MPGYSASQLNGWPKLGGEKGGLNVHNWVILTQERIGAHARKDPIGRRNTPLDSLECTLAFALLRVQPRRSVGPDVGSRFDYRQF